MIMILFSLFLVLAFSLSHFLTSSFSFSFLLFSSSLSFILLFSSCFVLFNLVKKNFKTRLFKLTVFSFLVLIIIGLLSGKIRSIGVSNFEIEDLQTLQNIKKKEIAVVQNWFDPFYTDDHVRNWCKENGVAYMGHR